MTATNAMIDDKVFSMDKIADGYSKEALAAYFGRPRLDYPTLSVFDRDGGLVVVLFEKMKSAAYVLYDLNGRAVHAFNVKLLTPPSDEAVKGVSMADFFSEHGDPHADLGNGRSIPAYLGIDAKIYRPVVIKGRIKQLIAIPLLPTG